MRGEDLKACFVQAGRQASTVEAREGTVRKRIMARIMPWSEDRVARRPV